MKLFAVLSAALFVLLGCAKEETAISELKREKVLFLFWFITIKETLLLNKQSKNLKLI